MYDNNPSVGIAPEGNTEKSYEIRVLDHNREIFRKYPLLATSDEEAIDLAHLVGGAVLMQVWHSDRLVHEIGAE